MARFRHVPDLVFILWGVVLVTALLLIDHQAPAGRRVLKVTGRDSVHYFANAHSILFDRDFDLRNQLAAMKPGVDALELPGREGINGLPGSPWAIGYSLLSIPFLAIGSLADALAGRSADGYGIGAVTGYFLANIGLVVIGLICQMRFLRNVGYSPLVATLVSLATWFSTTLVFYTFSPMSHVATFAMASVFLLVWSRVHETVGARGWFILGLFGGLLSLCRWQDAAFLIAPVLFAIGRDLAPWRRWLAYGCGIAVGFVPQIVQWRAVYGEWVTFPYASELAELPPRHIHQTLFSTDHGWFIWTPVTLIGVLGLLRSARRFWPWLVVIGLELAVVGSFVRYWNCGDSFGIRMLTSCTPLVALGVAELLSRTQRQWRAVLVASVGACCIWTTLFAAQYRLDMVPRQGTLTSSELFWDKLFLKDAYERRQSAPAPVR